MIKAEETRKLMPSVKAGDVLSILETHIKAAAEADRASCRVGSDLVAWDRLDPRDWEIVHCKLIVAGYGTEWLCPTVLRISWFGT